MMRMSAQGKGSPTLSPRRPVSPGGTIVTGDVVSVAPYTFIKTRFGRSRASESIVACGMGAPP